MKFPPIMSELSVDDHVHMIFSSGFFYLTKQGSTETTVKVIRQVYDKKKDEWVTFDPSTVSHAARGPLARQMFRRGLKIPEIAKLFKVDQSYVKSDVAFKA